VKTENLRRYLNSFGKQVVNRSKGNLQRKKGGNTALGNSIKFKVVSKGDSLTVEFIMSSYGKFVDKGVSGTKRTRTFKDFKNKTIRSPFSYKNSKGHSQPPTKALDKWLVKKGIAPRDVKGKFTSRKSLKFLIARSIGRNGIQGISFFQKPLGLAMVGFKAQVSKAIKKDILDELKGKVKEKTKK